MSRKLLEAGDMFGIDVGPVSGASHIVYRRGGPTPSAMSKKGRQGSVLLARRWEHGLGTGPAVMTRTLFTVWSRETRHPERPNPEKARSKKMKRAVERENQKP